VASAWARGHKTLPMSTLVMATAEVVSAAAAAVSAQIPMSMPMPRPWAQVSPDTAASTDRPPWRVLRDGRAVAIRRVSCRV
jgi:hypothetical protein